MRRKSQEHSIMKKEYIMSFMIKQGNIKHDLRISKEKDNKSKIALDCIYAVLDFLKISMKEN